MTVNFFTRFRPVSHPSFAGLAAATISLERSTEKGERKKTQTRFNTLRPLKPHTRKNYDTCKFNRQTLHTTQVSSINKQYSPTKSEEHGISHKPAPSAHAQFVLHSPPLVDMSTGESPLAPRVCEARL